MKKDAGIYCIRFGINPRIYIGSTMNCSRRKGQHLYKLRRNSHDNPKLQNYYNKYGEELFSFQVLETLPGFPFEEVRTKEQEYLNKYFAQEYIASGFKDLRFDDLLLNVTPEVDIMRVHWTEERKAALVLRNKNFKWSPELRTQVSQSKIGHKLSLEAEVRRQDSCEKYRESNALSRDLSCLKCGHYRTRKLGMRAGKQRVKCLKCGKGSSIKLEFGPLDSDV